MNLTKQVDAFDVAEIQAQALAYAKRVAPRQGMTDDPIPSAVYRAFYDGYMQAWMQARLEAKKLMGDL